MSRMESLDIILERAPRRYTEEEKLALAEEKNRIYRKLLEQMTPGDLPGEVKDTLQKLAKIDIIKAIGSSSRNTKFILERIGLENYFDAVSDGTNISRSKPDPEVFQKAAEMLGLAPGECLVVEDARAGIEAARAGGFDSAGLGEAADHEQVTYPIKGLSELIPLLNAQEYLNA